MPRLTILFIMLFPAGAALAQSNCASYEPAVTSLEGRLASAVAFGPPGYGETPKEDTREHYLGGCGVRSAALRVPRGG